MVLMLTRWGGKMFRIHCFFPVNNEKVFLLRSPL